MRSSLVSNRMARSACIAACLCSDASRQSEPEVVVAEGRVELAAQGDPAHRARVPPRSAARGAPHALVRPRRIPLR